jgi:hypothetical protein
MDGNFNRGKRLRCARSGGNAQCDPRNGRRLGLDDGYDVFYIIVMISNIIYRLSDMEIER